MNNNKSKDSEKDQKKSLKFGDIYPEICPTREAMIERRIRNSMILSKVVLFMHYKLKHTNPSPNTTIKEMCNELEFGYVQGQIIMSDMVNLGLVKKHKISHKKAIWIPTNEIEYYVKLAYKTVTGKEMAKA